MSTCGHSWQPISGWSGRYRCEWCGAIAFRKLVDGVHPGRHSENDKLQCYACSFPLCSEPAVRVDRKRGKNYCALHLGAMGGR